MDTIAYNALISTLEKGGRERFGTQKKGRGVTMMNCDQKDRSLKSDIIEEPQIMM